MTEITNIYKCTPRQVREFCTDILEAGLVPNVLSSPGMGKSSILRALAKAYNLFLIDHRLSTSTPEDLSGLPKFKDDRATFVPFDLFPVEGTPIPEGYDGWLLFLDEWTAAKRDVQAAAYKLILDKMVGQARLHEHVGIACAGNLMTDHAIANPLSTAMQSRVIHLEMEISHPEWLEDVAIAEDYDERIIGFLNYMPKYLMDFKPDHNDKTFSCPRTWEFMNKLVSDKEVTDRKMPLYAGTITSGVAAEFVTFTKLYKGMITIREIINDPLGCAIPSDTGLRWAVVTHILGKVDDTNFTDISAYINRFSLDFRILFFRYIVSQHQELRTHPDFRASMSQVAKYLNPAKML